MASTAAATVVTQQLPKRARQILTWSALELKPLVPSMTIPQMEGKVVLVENVA
jgi:hypothetical protein